MVFVGQRIDHRNGGNARQFLNVGVTEGPDHDAVQIPAQHLCGVGDGFAAADLHPSLIEIKRRAAELMDADLERNPGPGRGLGENQTDALAREGLEIAPPAFPLESDGQFEQFFELAVVQIPQRQ
ncbi:hypothetical protein SDC9_112431 [bioreactor metagenome]|uniref:Uncharacterized protein n=1 Tax=bioreactor metagenome TaxID=1076179 RepID=A0A645BUS8_9ZZZZ